MGDDLAYPWGEHGARLGGLTKRELFAAMMAQGLCANSDPKIAACNSAWIAGASVDMADALLAELSSDMFARTTGRE